MKDIFVVGLTGPTGAGKTTVAKKLRARGISTINADEVSRRVTQEDAHALKELVCGFGTTILNDDGTLNRKRLAHIAFSDAEQNRKLTDILHPLIMMETRRQLRRLALAGAKIAILDAALLFESNAYLLCDTTVAVLADDETRMVRIMERDKLNRQEAMERINAQNPLNFYRTHANHIITNIGSESALDYSVTQLERELRRASYETLR